MLHEVKEALAIKPSGIYVDGTFGRGGHAEAILQTLGTAGRLYAVDRDPAAVLDAHRFAQDNRFTIQHGSFDMLSRYCRDWGITGKINGLLLDLGVSSPQLDNPERGFSFSHEGPLDMRMDNASGQTASAWLNSATEAEIADVLWRYGEERNSRRIARQIVMQRQQQPVETTRQLADIIISASPGFDRQKHPATRSFQAIRIFINRELDSLQTFLTDCLDLLVSGGRLVVISFHSLEDRIVKRFLREQALGRELPRNLPVAESRYGQTMRLIGKAQKAADEEVRDNPRARSAVLRVAEKL
jgi:16S rRNA (cytosine1402-N4)-methyltransferase